ncbi:MAG: hypothetical protein KDD94_02805 [Calditrichaeota bacterium]|nr:hypothetical protein [Calditrichota bacterium]
MQKLPDLSLDNWLDSRNTIQSYAKLLSEIRRSLTPTARHWFHLSLHTWAKGLTTSPIPIYKSPQMNSFEILLDLVDHRLVIDSNIGTHLELRLDGQPVEKLYDNIKPFLKMTLSQVDVDIKSIAIDKYDYDETAIENYANVLSQLDLYYKEFAGKLRAGAGPVQLWPDHFDLALLWFSGRAVAGIDPTDDDHADEQMNFGFSTGDNSINEPYFYITAYPKPFNFTLLDLDLPAYWYSMDFTAIIFHYSDWIKLKNPKQFLIDFMLDIQEKTRSLMFGA